MGDFKNLLDCWLLMLTKGDNEIRIKVLNKVKDFKNMFNLAKETNFNIFQTLSDVIVQLMNHKNWRIRLQSI